MLIVFLLLPLLSYAANSNGAFCAANNSAIVDFPLPAPKTFLTPWVWDAIENTEHKTVEITIVPRRGCWFNHTLWQILNEKVPQHSKFLGYGLSENILVESEAPTNPLVDGYSRHRDSLYGERLNCIYYNNGNSLPIARSISQRVMGDTEWMPYSTVQIVCPSPGIKFDEMRIERVTRKSINGSPVIPLKSQTHDLTVSITDSFPVCQSTELVKGIVKTSMDKKGRYYGISVCTATGRINRRDLVEWLEYHQHLGVDHFFIYLTSLVSQHSIAYAALSDYVTEGIVTIVPWGYQNCVRGMASGRWCHWFNINATVDNGTYFHPPRPIAQSAALASCYSRFKRFTKYMMHIDDDEFVAMNSSLVRPRSKNRGRKANKRLKFRGALFDYANRMFLMNPHAAAIHIRPVGKYNCPSAELFGKKKIEVSSGLEVPKLPRIGKHLVSRLIPSYESKLLMRTDAVRMFYIHYISQLEEPYNSYSPVEIDNKDVVLLHYKIAPRVTGIIWGEQGINLDWPQEPFACQTFRLFGGYKEDIENGSYLPSNNISTVTSIGHDPYWIQSVDMYSRKVLLINYLLRMLKI